MWSFTQKGFKMMNVIDQALLAGGKFELWLTNTKGHYKFWTARHDGNGIVYISYGPIGSYGKTIKKDLAYFEKTAPKKLKKGYEVYRFSQEA